MNLKTSVLYHTTLVATGILEELSILFSQAYIFILILQTY